MTINKVKKMPREAGDMPHHIDIEDTGTWPEEFLAIMMGNKNLFIDFHNEYHRIDLLQRESVALRVNPPVNPYENQYSQVVSVLAEILEEENIVGYHCTRLTPSEIKGILNTGMNILTRDLVTARLALALKEGHLTQAQYGYITTCEELEWSLSNQNGQRTGYIWFCPNRSSLTDGGGVSRLFRSWGGEAVYNGHEHKDNEGLIFRSIGTPCIVKASVPVEDIDEDVETLAKKFISQFIFSDLDFYPHPSAGFDMSVERDLASAEILEIIEFNDPRFAEFTNHAEWYEDELLP